MVIKLQATVKELMTRNLKGIPTAISHILQEALTNVAGHTGSSEVNISISRNCSSLVFMVEDIERGIMEEETYGTGAVRLSGLGNEIIP